MNGGALVHLAGASVLGCSESMCSRALVWLEPLFCAVLSQCVVGHCLARAFVLDCCVSVCSWAFVWLEPLF